MTMTARRLVRDAAWRQMQLKRAGVRQADLARDLGEAESTVSRVMAGTYDDRTERGRARRDRIEGAIAGACGLSTLFMFPRKKERPHR